MADLNSTRPTTVHPGVDAQSWLGFEQRIQARRFDALLNSAREAITNGNAVLARHALDEARDMRPHDPALIELEAQLFQLATPPGHNGALWRRAVSATAMLLVGIGMVLALDSTRLGPESLPIVAPPSPMMFNSADIPATEEALPGSLPAPAHAGGGAASEQPDAEEAVARPALTRARAIEPAVEPVRPAAPPLSVEPERQSETPPLAAIGATLLTATPATSVVPRPASAVIAAGPAVVERETAAEDRSRVAEVLRRYARAYGELDARAAREVWPAVDERALARAFDSLASQSVSFDDCQIDVRGAVANASCRGQASYVGKVGHGEPRIEPRTWRFELRREGDTWKIENAEARRIIG